MGVVTFYDLFHRKPVGRHRLRVCTNLSCSLRGAGEIMATLRKELGVDEDEVTPDGRCSYVHFECLGSCDTAPMMMVDDEYQENLTPTKVRELLGRLR
jgi:NADH-quinone oxidoreductase subunit E